MKKIDEVIAHIKCSHVYIQTHNFPDPDAISSAFGLQKLLAHKNIDATICYKGKIDRYNTCLLHTSVPLMSLGAIGVISVWSNVAPKQVHDMCMKFFERCV